MRLCVKRTYCPDCKRLVRGKEQREQGDTPTIHISCARCGRLLYVGNGVTWKYARNAS